LLKVYGLLYFAHRIYFIYLDIFILFIFYIYDRWWTRPWTRFYHV